MAGGFIGRAAGSFSKKAPAIGKGLTLADTKMAGAYRWAGKFGKELEGDAAVLARGRRRTLIGGAGVAGLGLMGQGRSVGISSGANGASPSSMGGATGY
jgi:hypothetical protein